MTRTVSPIPEQELAEARQALVEQRLRGLGQPSSDIRPRARGGPVPLSPVQHAIWVDRQLRDDSTVYNVPRAWRVRGPVDVAALREAFGALVARHEILRTTFVDGEAPTQRVMPARPADFAHLDGATGAARSPRQRWDDAVRTARSIAERPFDLAVDAPLRAALVSTDRTEHLLLVVMDHLVSDEWSSGVLTRELSACYKAATAGRSADLPPLPIQYADYALWQADQAAGRRRATQLTYWRDVLSTVAHTLDLPTDRTRPPAPSHRGRRTAHRLPRELAEAVRKLAATEGVTVFVTLLSAVQAVLARYTGQRRFAVGSMLAGRGSAATEPLIGLFANTVALPADLTGAPSFVELLRRNSRTVRQALDHQDVTFEHVVSALNAARDPSRNPVFQVLFQVGEQRTPWRLGDATAQPVVLGDFDIPVDLILRGVDGPETIDLEVDYAIELFEAPTAARLLEHTANFLRSAVAEPSRAIDASPILSPAEQSVLTEDWARSEVDFPDATTIHAMVEATARRQPDAVAVLDDGAATSYRDLDERADRLARLLRSRGVRRGSTVGAFLNHRPEVATVFLGVLKAGAVYLPLPGDLPPGRVAFMLEDAGVEVVVSASDVIARLPEYTGEVVLVDGDIDEPDAGGPDVDGAGPDDPAYVMYTSGSTGRPKGVVLAHRGAVNLARAEQEVFGTGPGKRVLQFASIGFDVSVGEMLQALTTGATLCVNRRSAGFAPEDLVDYLRGSGVDLAFLPPSVLATVPLDRLPAGLTVGAGGERCPVELAHRISRTHTFVNIYGPTEATVWATAEQGPVDPQRGSASIGRPLANYETLILDADLRAVPVGVPGELCLAGVGLALGYLHRPGLTAERFVPHPYAASPGARMYRTGDLARWRPDGTIEYLGRLDHQVKVRGFRIELGEVESCLRRHPAVRDAVVVAATPHDQPAQLIAYAVAAAGEPTATELRRFLAEQLPDWMLPARYVWLPGIPLTPSGKVNRAALPAPTAARPDVEATYRAPATAAERTLAGIWAQVLGVEQLGVDDNFFDLGGDSLRAIHISTQARHAGLTATPRHIFTYQTVAQLAEAIGAEPDNTTPVPPARSGHADGLDPQTRDKALAQVDATDVADIYPLSPLQSGMLLDTLRSPRSGAYVEQTAFTIDGDLDADRFLEAWQHVVTRHDILRTSVVWSGVPRPVQLVHRRARPAVRRLDWTGLSTVDVSNRLRRLLAQERSRGFAFTPGALPHRFDLIRTGPDRHAFVWHHHHLLVDAWSGVLVLDEVFGTYAALRATGGPPALPDPVPYRRYIDWLGRADAEAAAAYWRRSLDGVRSRTWMPVVAPPRRSETGVDQQLVTLTDAETEALRQAARRHRVTPGVFAVAAWALLVSRYSGEPDVLVGTTLSGRAADFAGVDAVVGPVINTVPVRVRLDPAARVDEWLRSLHTDQVQLREYEHTPLVETQRYTAIPAGSPMFDSIVVFHNVPEPRDTAPGGLRLTAVETAAQTGIPLVLDVGLADRLVIELTYQCGRVSEEDAGRLLAQYRHALAQLVDDPDRRVGQLTPLPPAEASLVLGRWSAVADVPTTPVLDLFAEQVRTRSDAPAVVDADGTVVSYRELDARADRLARRLRERGLRREDPVLIRLPGAADQVTAAVAVAKAGGVMVTPDAARPDGGWQDAVTITDRPGDGVAVGDAEVAEQDAGDIRVAPAHPDQLWAVVSTAGASGPAKQVGLTHGNLAALIADRTWDGFAAGRTLLGSRPGTVAFLQEVWVPLTRGGCCVAGLAPAGLPDVAAALLPTGRLTSLEVNSLGGVRHLWIGSDPIPPAAVRELREHCPHTTIVNAYGAAETGGTVLTCPVPADRPVPAPVPIGRPMSAVRVYLLDRNLRPVPVGATGALYVGGDRVARGYPGMPAATAESFLPDPWGAPGDRMFGTGDLGRWRGDGVIELVGRVQHHEASRHARADLAALEATATGDPDVSHAAVVPAAGTDGRWRLTTYVAAAPGRTADVQRLRSSLLDAHPDLGVPLDLVVLDEPVTTVDGSKLDRAALPAPDAPHAVRTHRPPSTDTERILADVWAAVLGVERVGADDDFFELGGDSILSIRVVGLARAAGVDISIREVFERRTLARLAATEGTTEVRAEQGTVTGPVPLTPAMRWFVDTFGALDHYAMPVAVASAEALDTAALRTSLDLLVAHHDMLRLRLSYQDGRWVGQLPATAPPVPFDVVDLTGYPPGEHAAVRRQYGSRAQACLSLTGGRLLRAVLFRNGTHGTDELMVAAHHLVVDAVSWNILLTDLEAIYRQVVAGGPVELPAKTTSFRYWAERLAAHTDRITRAADRPAAPAGALPVDFRRGPDTENTTQTETAMLSGPDTDLLLRRASGRYDTQINDLLLAALARTVTEWTGDDTVLVSVETHGREPLFDDVDLSRTVGWFTNMAPIPLRLPDGGWAAHVPAVKEQLRSAPYHGLELGLTRGPGERSEPPISFNYRGQFDRQKRSDEGLFQRTIESPGDSYAAGATRPHLIDVDAFVVDGRLTAYWSFSARRYRPETVKRLAERYVANLSAVVRHCVAHRAQAGGQFTGDIRPGSAIVRAAMRRRCVPGVGIAVMRDGQLEDAWGEGVTLAGSPNQVTDTTIFPAGSTSKHVSTIAALALVRDGVLDLDADINRYLGSLRLSVTDPAREPITLRQLLSHTSGLAQVPHIVYTRDRDLPTLVDVVQGRRPSRGPAAHRIAPPGTRYNYSNSNFALLELVMVAATGRPFPELAQALVLDPLGLADSSFDPEFPLRRPSVATGHDAEGSPGEVPVPMAIEVAEGGFWTTPADLARVAHEVRRATRGEPSTVLTEELATLMVTRSAFADYGLGTFVNGAPEHRWFGHAGDIEVGYHCLTMCYLAQGSGMVVMSNGVGGAKLVSDLLSAAAR